MASPFINVYTRLINQFALCISQSVGPPGPPGKLIIIVTHHLTLISLSVTLLSFHTVLCSQANQVCKSLTFLDADF